MNKGLEILKEIHELVTYPLTESSIVKIKDNIAIIEKELKALEIIKEKKVNVGLLSKAFTLENGLVFYNENIQFANGILSLIQEEYDLLKEVLL